MSSFTEFYVSGFIVVLLLVIYINRYDKEYTLSLGEAITVSLFSWLVIVSLVISTIIVVIYKVFPKDIYYKLDTLWKRITTWIEKRV